MKYFFASVVGMLRDKTSDLAELNTLVSGGVKERWELLQQRRLDEQEDVLYRLREVSACHNDLLKLLCEANWFCCYFY